MILLKYNGSANINDNYDIKDDNDDNSIYINNAVIITTMMIIKR